MTSEASKKIVDALKYDQRLLKYLQGSVELASEEIIDLTSKVIAV